VTLALLILNYQTAKEPSTTHSDNTTNRQKKTWCINQPISVIGYKKYIGENIDIEGFGG